MIYNINGGYAGNHPIENAPRLRVMTFNVGGWYCGTGRNIPAAEYQDYLALHRGIIERNSPDIMTINEYWSVMSDNGALAQDMLSEYFPYIHEQNGSEVYMGRCICSKFPISDYEAHTYDTPNGPTRKVYYDSCVVTLPNGMNIDLLLTHMDPNDGIPERDLETAELIEYLKGKGRFIACGDYNSDIDVASKNTEKYRHAAKPFVDEGYNLANWGDFGFLTTWSYVPEGTYENSIDNIITSPGIQINNVYVDTAKRTDELTGRIDHMPLIADLQIVDVLLAEVIENAGD